MLLFLRCPYMIAVEKLIERCDAETALLVLLCRMYIGTAEQQALTDFMDGYAAQIDYDQLHLYLRYHSIRPVAYKILQQEKERLPKAFMDELQADCMNIKLKALRDMVEGKRLVKLLASHGINGILYKGPVFSDIYYGDPGMRESSDVDVFVPKQDIPAIHALMEGQGYKAVLNSGDHRSGVNHVNDDCLAVNNDKGDERHVHMEFHYGLLTRAYCLRERYASFAHDSTEYKKGGEAVRVMSDAGSAKMLLAHHGLQDLWASMKYYLDLAMVSKELNTAEWEQVSAFVQHNGIAGVSAAGAHNLYQLLGVEIPMYREAAADVYADKLLQLVLRPFEYIDKDAYKFGLRIKGRDGVWKLKMCVTAGAAIVRPNLNDMRWVYFPRQLSWLYYIVKPVRLLMNVTTASKKPN